MPTFSPSSSKIRKNRQFAGILTMLNAFFSEVQVPPFTMRWLRLVINGDFFMAKEKKKKPPLESTCRSFALSF